MSGLDDEGTWAPGWSAERREKWKRAYNAGEPVQLPTEDHEPGECDHCDTLRDLMAEEEDATHDA